MKKKLLLVFFVLSLGFSVNSRAEFNTQEKSVISSIIKKNEESLKSQDFNPASIHSIKSLVKTELFSLSLRSHSEWGENEEKALDSLVQDSVEGLRKGEWKPISKDGGSHFSVSSQDDSESNDSNSLLRALEGLPKVSSSDSGDSEALSFDFPKVPSAPVCLSAASDSADSLMQRFKALQGDVKKVGSAIDCDIIFKKTHLPNQEPLTCEEVPSENMGFNAVKVFLLKDPKGVAQYAVKGFAGDDQCRNEARKLALLNEEVKRAIRPSSPEYRLFQRSRNPDASPLTLPESIDVSQMVAHHETSPCFLVLEAARGKPVFSFAKQYVESGEGDLSVFSQLGKQLAEFQIYNSLASSSEEGLSIDQLKIASHGDFHWNNVFYDPVTRRYTFIDNATFNVRREHTSSKDLGSSIGALQIIIADDLQNVTKRMSQSSDVNLSWLKRDQEKLVRKMQLLDEFLKGYSNALASKKVKYDGKPAELGVKEKHFNPLVDYFNEVVSSCRKKFCQEKTQGVCNECASRW
jgi:hypothetical protein